MGFTRNLLATFIVVTVTVTPVSAIVAAVVVVGGGGRKAEVEGDRRIKQYAPSLSWAR